MKILKTIAFFSAFFFIGGGWNVGFAKETDMALPGQVVAQPQHSQWLQYSEGDPFFLAGLADPEGFFYRGIRNTDGTRDGDQIDIIDRVKEFGGNTLYVQIIRSHGGDGSPDHNPFVDSDPKKGLDEDILNQWEEWFRALDDTEITAFVFLYDDNIQVSRDLNWPLDRSGNLDSGEREFIREIVNRFEHHSNIIWVVMEEVEEMSRWQMPFSLGISASWLLAHREMTFAIAFAAALMLLIGMARARQATFIVLGMLVIFSGIFSWYYLIPSNEYVAHTKKIAEFIRQTDDYDHLIAVHKARKPDFTEFADDPNIDIYMMMTNPGSVDIEQYHSDSLEAVRIAKGRYVVVYAEIFPLREVLQAGDEETVRKVHWAVAMGGAYPMLVGPWDDYRGTFPSEGVLRDMREMQKFFESTNLSEMVSHDELKYADTQYVLANPGKQYIVYSSIGSEEFGLQDMTAGRYDFLWYDIESDRLVLQKDVQVENGNQAWAIPQDMSGEITLYITND